MKLCDYGCGQIATHQFKNGKWCCSNNIAKCPISKIKLKNKLSGKPKTELHKKHIGQSGKGRSPWNKGKKGLQTAWNKGKKGQSPWSKGLTKYTDNRLLSISINMSKTNPERMKELWKKEDSIFNSKEYKNKLKIINLGYKNPNYLTIRKIKERYPFFSLEEEMRYNPDKPDKKEIQVHCKNHNCPNSKEQGGWFTPTKSQTHERIRQIEKEDGSGGCYFYCSDKCKNECPLYNLKSDPFKNNVTLYTQTEYQTFRDYVLKRDNYECQKCGSKKDLHCHHIIPIKIEPMFALDPDNGIVLCQECHYEIGHKTGTECSTGNLANKTCIGATQ